MPATTHATRAEALAEIVRRARKAGIIVKFDHAGIVVLENPLDAQAATPAQSEERPSAGDAPAQP